MLKVPHQVAVLKKVRMKVNLMQARFRVRQGQKGRRTIANLDQRGKLQKTTTKEHFSLNDEEIEELSSWIFSTQEVAQVEAEIRPQVVGSPRVKLFSEREQSTKHMLSEARLGFSSLVFVASFQNWRVTALSYQISKIQ